MASGSDSLLGLACTCLFLTVAKFLFARTCSISVGMCLLSFLDSDQLGIEALLLKTKSELERIEKVGHSVRKSAFAWLQVEI